MSIRFAIRSTPAPAQKEGNQIVRFSGTSEPFNQKSERFAEKIGVDGGGNDRIRFRTGLDEKNVEWLPWYNEEEKKQVINQIKE